MTTLLKNRAMKTSKKVGSYNHFVLLRHMSLPVHKMIPFIEKDKENFCLPLYYGSKHFKIMFHHKSTAIL